MTAQEILIPYDELEMQSEYSPAPIEFVEITTTVNQMDTEATVTPMMQMYPESPQTPMATATTTPQSNDD